MDDMATELDQFDLDITKEIINIGLAKAADSLSHFLNESVYLNPFDVKFNSENYFPLSKKEYKNNCYLLTTIIKGDFGGKAYLIFSDQEVETLLSTAGVDLNAFEDPEVKLALAADFLLETDNIITASVVTQFANLLNHKIYGDVPKLNVMPSNELNEYLHNTNSGDLKIFYFSTEFRTKKVNVSPEFIWLLDDNFFNQVSKMMEQDKKKEILSQLNSNA